MEHRKNVCIICEADTEGVQIKEDYGIAFLRAVKKLFTNKINRNRLVVCQGCMPKYQERRKKFENSLNLVMIVSLVIGLMLVVLPIVSMKLPDFAGLLFGVLFCVMFLILAHLSYIPPLEKIDKKPAPQAASANQEPKHSAEATGKPK